MQTARDVIAKIVVPCLLPTGDKGKCTVATVDQFGPSLADQFIKALDAAGYRIVPKNYRLSELVDKITPENLHPES